jgi:hypothetical protein
LIIYEPAARTTQLDLAVDDGPLDALVLGRRLLAVLGVMLASMPVWFLVSDSTFGGDFRNVYDFHHCLYKNAPYAEGATSCDPRGWPMNYPPLLYWSFGWVRRLSFEMAYAVWAACIAAGILCAAWVWSGLSPGALRLPEWSRSIFAAGLLFLFPSVFAITTGNNDVAVLLLWSSSCMAFLRGRVFLAGFVAGLAAAYKLYPLVAIAAVIAALALRDRRGGVRFGAGVVAALLAQAVVFASDLVTYLSGNLARYVSLRPGPSWYSHSVPSTAAAYVAEGTGLMISGVLFLAWLAVLAGNRRTSMTLVFAGSLAISTYLSTTSYDYNLITTFPLLAYLFVTAFTTTGFRSQILFAGLLVGLLVLGNRNLVLVVERGREFYGVAQVVWLFAVTVILSWTSAGQQPVPSPQTMPAS